MATPTKTDRQFGKVAVGVAVLFLLGLVALLWGSALKLLGWPLTLAGLFLGLGTLLAGARIVRKRERLWVPEDDVRFVKALRTQYGFTPDQAWDIVEYLGRILGNEHTEAHAWFFVRRMVMRADQDRVVRILKSLAGPTGKDGA